MKLQTEATQVAVRTALLMRAGAGAAGAGERAAVAEPTWFRTVLAHPPTHQLLPRLRRLTLEPQPKRAAAAAAAHTDAAGAREFYTTRNKRRVGTAAAHLYATPRLAYTEDAVRREFYSTHPWELARPRSVVERDGRTLAGRDWASIRQPGLRLTGEHVVQRTLWLAAQPAYAAKHGRDWHAAYTQARLEFYRLRIREHAEQEVAAEEALMTGAVFGPSAVAHNLAKEQAVIDDYVVKATAEAKRRLAAQSKE